MTEKSVKKSLVVLLTIVPVLLFSSSAFPAFRYKITNKLEGPKGTRSFFVDALVDGENGRFVIQEAVKAPVRAGNYILTSDGGQKMYVVNPDEGTCSLWTRDALSRLLGDAMHYMEKESNVAVSNARVEKELEEPGPEMMGLRTTHHRYRASFSVTAMVVLKRLSFDVDLTEDYWITDDVSDRAMEVLLGNTLTSTGYEPIDEALLSRKAGITGVVLKKEEYRKIRYLLGRTKRTKVTQEIIDLKEIDPREIPSDYFLIPECREVSRDRMWEWLYQLIQGRLKR